MHNKDTKAINEAYNVVGERYMYGNRKPAIPTQEVYVTDQELTSGGRTYEDNGNYKYTRLGINKILGWMFVYDYDLIEEHDDFAAERVNVVDFDSVNEVEESGLKAGWLIKVGNDVRWNQKGNLQYEKWLKQHRIPNTKVNLKFIDDEGVNYMDEPY